MKKNDIDRFWSQVSYGAPGECWLWTGGLRRGRGRIKIEGRTVVAPRVAYMLAKPSMFDPDLFVLHTCDNPKCCRPGHLYQGTHADNVRDRVSRGRSYNVLGEEHGMAKLTADQVRAIRRDTRLH